MDRGTFFQALPFLSPCSGSSASSWPPADGKKSELILKDHLLSIEPISGGPACFAAHGVDSSMFRLDICLVEQDEVGLKTATPQKQAVSPAASSASTSLSMSQSPKQVHAPDSRHDSSKGSSTKEHSVLIQIDRTFVYKLNLSELQRVEFQHGTPNQISYMLMHFDCCCFRVFSTDKEVSNKEELLQSASSRLQQACLNMRRKSGAIASPTSSGSGSTDVVANVHHDESSSPESAATRRFKRRKVTLNASLDRLQSLQTVVNMPSNTFDGGMIADAICPLLTATADELSSSYSKSVDVSRAWQNCSNEVAECDKEIEDVFVAGFPNPRSKQRRGMSTSPTTANNKTTEPADMPEGLSRSTRKLLQKRLEAAKKRLRVSLVPIRE